MARYQLIATLDVDEDKLARHREQWPRLTPASDDATTWTAVELVDLGLDAYENTTPGDYHPATIVEDSEHALTIERIRS